MTDDLKAAIERVQYCDPSELVPGDIPTVLRLAEIGRLAVEERAVRVEDLPHKDRADWQRRWAAVNGTTNAAADAFLAGRGT